MLAKVLYVHSYTFRVALHVLSSWVKVILSSLRTKGNIGEAPGSLGYTDSPVMSSMLPKDKDESASLFADGLGSQGLLHTTTAASSACLLCYAAAACCHMVLGGHRAQKLEP